MCRWYRYIGMYEHMRDTLRTWDVKSMGDLTCETFVLSFSDEDCHRDIITVVVRTTHSRFTDKGTDMRSNTRTFSIGVFL